MIVKREARCERAREGLPVAACERAAECAPRVHGRLPRAFARLEARIELGVGGALIVRVEADDRELIAARIHFDDQEQVDLAQTDVARRASPNHLHEHEPVASRRENAGLERSGSHLDLLTEAGEPLVAACVELGEPRAVEDPHLRRDERAEARPVVRLDRGDTALDRARRGVGEDAVRRAVGQLPEDESGVMYRGRAADKLAGHAPQQPWNEFTACPYEDLVEPGRIHVDPLGYLHICQGISIGILFEQPLSAICQAYQPQEHPIVGPLLDGGPAELVRRYGLLHAEGYADACHLCYTARLALRSRFPEVLLPNQMYGVF